MANNIQLSTLGGVLKTAYESQSNTNVFSDADKAKLQNILEGNLTDGYIIIGTASGTATQIKLPSYLAGQWTEVALNLSVSSLVWSQTVTHNLGYKPVIKVVKSNGVEVDLYIKHLSDDEFVLKSLINFSGSILML